MSYKIFFIEKLVLENMSVNVLSFEGDMLVCRGCDVSDFKIKAKKMTLDRTSFQSNFNSLIQKIHFTDVDFNKSQPNFKILDKLQSLTIKYTSPQWNSLKSLISLENSQLSFLDVSNSNITDLTPLKACFSLKTLILVGCKIRSLKPLQFINLTFLDVSFTMVTDLSFISPLT